MKTLMTVNLVPVQWDGERITFTAGMAVDADGSPKAYAPNNKGLDYTANAGRPGKWWGVYTVDGVPVIQSGEKPEQPCKGYYISTTSLYRREHKRDDVRRYIDAEAVPFVVVPSGLLRLVKPVVLGCKARITRTLPNGKTLTVDAVVADVGPASKLGEASIAAAKALKVPHDPKKGGSDKPQFTYEIWPGVPAEVNGETFELIAVG